MASGGVWRRQSARVESAFDKAASAWSKQHRSAADSSMAPLFAPPGDYAAEAILQQRRLPKRAWAHIRVPCQMGGLAGGERDVGAGGASIIVRVFARRV